MSHVLHHDGHYFRIEIGEVVGSSGDKNQYVAWCSDPVKELRDVPKQALSRFVGGAPLASHAEALRHAQDWVKSNWTSLDAKGGKPPRSLPQTYDGAGVVYTVWLFKGETPLGFDFGEYSDAKAFAKSAEKSLELNRVGITNRESPQYLAVWEKGS